MAPDGTEAARWLTPRCTYRVRGPLTELTLARIRELTREPEAVFWVFVFPILLAAILGLAFRSRPPEALPVASSTDPHAEARLAALRRGPDLKPAHSAEAEARQALARGHVVLVVVRRRRADLRATTPRSPRAARRAWPSTPRSSARRGVPTPSPRQRVSHASRAPATSTSWSQVCSA